MAESKPAQKGAKKSRHETYRIELTAGEKTSCSGIRRSLRPQHFVSIFPPNAACYDG